MKGQVVAWQNIPFRKENNHDSNNSWDTPVEINNIKIFWEELKTHETKPLKDEIPLMGDLNTWVRKKEISNLKGTSKTPESTPTKIRRVCRNKWLKNYKNAWKKNIWIPFTRDYRSLKDYVIIPQTFASRVANIHLYRGRNVRNYLRFLRSEIRLWSRWKIIKFNEKDQNTCGASIRETKFRKIFLYQQLIKQTFRSDNWKEKWAIIWKCIQKVSMEVLVWEHRILLRPFREKFSWMTKIKLVKELVQ